MTRYEKATKLKDVDFKQIIGVKKEIFEQMAEVLDDIIKTAKFRIKSPKAVN